MADGTHTTAKLKGKVQREGFLVQIPVQRVMVAILHVLAVEVDPSAAQAACIVLEQWYCCEATWLSTSLVNWCSICWATLVGSVCHLHTAVCKAGYQPSSDEEGACKRCKVGTFKPHKGNQMCEECAWPRTTEKTGAISSDACGELVEVF